MRGFEQLVVERLFEHPRDYHNAVPFDRTSSAKRYRADSPRSLSLRSSLQFSTTNTNNLKKIESARVRPRLHRVHGFLQDV